jgi:hypothetical protein
MAERREENFAAGAPSLERLVGFPTRPGSGLIAASTKPGKIPRIPGIPKVPKVKTAKIPKVKTPARVAN